jgi:hypothetical protein
MYIWVMIFASPFYSPYFCAFIFIIYASLQGLLESTDKYEFAPAFVLRKIVYDYDSSIRFSPKLLASMIFFKERMEDLDQLDLYCSLRLQVRFFCSSCIFFVFILFFFWFDLIFLFDFILFYLFIYLFILCFSVVKHL